MKRVSKIKQNHFYHLLLPRKENLTLSVVFFIAFVCVVCGGGAKENKAKIQEEKVGQKEWKRTVCKAKDGQLTCVSKLRGDGMVWVRVRSHTFSRFMPTLTIITYELFDLFFFNGFLRIFEDF